ncbi:MAG: hypothetical protein ACREN7_01385 [Candidatus Dormibacteria bacterium]
MDGLGVGQPEALARIPQLTPSRILPFALIAAAVCGLSGVGLLPLPAAVLLEVAAGACYLVGLRASLPRWPELPWPRLRQFSGMGPVILPLWGLASASLVLAAQPGLPGEALLPAGVLCLLALAPRLEIGEEGQPTFGGARAALVLLTVLVPLPVFILAMGSGMPAPLRGLLAGAAVLVPTWHLMGVSQRNSTFGLVRTAAVGVLVGLAAGATAMIQAPIELLPVALLLGWYGLAGLASSRQGSAKGGFALFVVLAAVMLAVASPL